MPRATKTTIPLGAAFAILFVAGCASTLPDAKRAGNGENESTRRAIEWAKQSAYQNAEKQSEEQWANPVGELVDDFEGSYGYTTLHIAAFKDQIERIKDLLEKGAEVDKRSGVVHLYGISLQRTPLHAAIHYHGHRNSRLGAVKALLKAGADANAQDWEGQTPLHYALRVHGDPLCSVVQALLDAGANPSLIVEDLKTQDLETCRPLAREGPTE